MDPTKPSDAVRDRIYTRVKADLEPTPLVTHAKIGGAIGLGGLVSLFLCGQLGFGLSSLAMAVHGIMMDVAGFMGCTVICGVLFAVVPVLALRLMSSGLQFLTLIRKWRVIAGWTLVFGSLLAYESGGADGLSVVLLWAAIAVASFKALARLVYEIGVRVRRAVV